MDRRRSGRALVDLPTCAIVAGFRHVGRVLELSSSGVVLERPPGLSDASLTGVPLELHLGGAGPLYARATPVWGYEKRLAMRFVGIADADRLRIAEYLDRTG